MGLARGTGQGPIKRLLHVGPGLDFFGWTGSANDSPILYIGYHFSIRFEHLRLWCAITGCVRHSPPLVTPKWRTHSPNLLLAAILARYILRPATTSSSARTLNARNYRAAEHLRPASPEPQTAANFTITRRPGAARARSAGGRLTCMDSVCFLRMVVAYTRTIVFDQS